jgi:indole-3-acetate monooxygenase
MVDSQARDSISMATAGHPPLSGSNWQLHWPALSDLAAETPNTSAIDDRCYQLLRDMHVFRTLLPKSLGGVEADPPDAMALIETLATLSGTIGWVSLVGVTGAIFAAELEPVAAQEIYADPDAIIAFAGAPNGILTRGKDGFVLSGRWDLASALSHASWVAVACRIADKSDSGTAVAIVPGSGCTISFSWDPIGLVGTGTGAVSINQVAVPAHRVIIDGPASDEQRSRRRLRQLIPSLIASVSLGIATAALDEAAQWLSAEPIPQTGSRRADSEYVQHLLGRAYAELCSARSFLREVTAETWQRACLGKDIGLDHGALHRLAATHAATVAAETSASIAAFAGTRSVTSADRICRRWVDARTITANITVRDLYYRVYGGVAANGQIPRSWPLRITMRVLAKDGDNDPAATKGEHCYPA